ncbi:MAG: hypothetical protein J6P53_04075, partial [Mailhella sp.]|nr:hypothetical protein [Mailhella sp.]
MLIILLLLTYESYKAFLGKFGTQSMELYVPLEYYYWMPVVGLGITAVVLVFQLLRDLVRCLAERHLIAPLLGLAFAAFLAWVP